MRTEKTQPPSFPVATMNAALAPVPGERWQVLCGDAGHWRVGVYSPAEASAKDCAELEQHDCPELFLLTSGRLTLVRVEQGRLCEQALELGKPVLVEGPHSGFCPDGAHTGTALVVERDAFETQYRTAAEWLA